MQVDFLTSLSAFFFGVNVERDLHTARASRKPASSWKLSSKAQSLWSCLRSVADAAALHTLLLGKYTPSWTGLIVLLHTTWARRSMFGEPNRSAFNVFVKIDSAFICSSAEHSIVLLMSLHLNHVSKLCTKQGLRYEADVLHLMHSGCHSCAGP